MKYLYSEKGTEQEITTIEEWRQAFYTGKHSIHWKVGRSAHAMSEYMMEKCGKFKIEQLLAKIIGENILLEKAFPEKEVVFDSYGRGRVHDLAIWGTTESGQKIFVGVEAKVDETFNDPIGKVYLAAKAKELRNVSTNACKRIEELMKKNFGDRITSSTFNLSYQLTYATMGTLAAKDEGKNAAIHVFLVLVFKTGKDYNAKKGTENHKAYRRFLKACGAKSTKREENTDVHRVKFGDQTLICCYHSI